MILQALVAYYETLAAKGKIARPGWEKVKVSYALEIDESGKLVDVLPLKSQTEDGKRTVPREMMLPARVKRASGISANFLCDNATYILGIGNKDKPQRVADCFAAAKLLHKDLLEGVEHPSAKAICAFFDLWDVVTAREHPMLLKYIEDLEKGANLVFFYNGQFAQENTEITHVWQAYYDRDQQGETMPCLVTGKRLVPTAIHPAIKGVAGAQANGAALVSFNAPAYCSFEREQNLNAPVSQYATFAYTTALNHLLADKKHTKRTGDMTIVYWAEDAEEAYQDFFSCSLDGSDNTVSNEDLDDLMSAVAQGKPVLWGGIPLKPDNHFYVLALSPNVARLSVRFFLRNDFGDMIKHLRAHYDRVRIVTDNRNKFHNIPLWALLQETVNKKSKDKQATPQMSGDTLRAILSGGRYPATLYQHAQIRIRAEREVTRGRAAIIKAYLMRNTDNQNYKEALTVDLNEHTTYQPYVLGRLFAVLEEVQNKASGVSTIKDKYFTSACATPAAIFPVIMNLSEKHLRKLESGVKIHYAKQIGALTAAITKSYPPHHNLNEQGIFQLGYYHQTQKRYQKKNTTQAKEEEIKNV